MNEAKQALKDHKMDLVIGNLLRGGVIIAAAVVFFGAIIYLSRHGLAPASYKIFLRVPPDLCSVKGILENVFSFHGRGFIQLGLLLLIATPLARVALSIFMFARQRDNLYAIVTLIVFCILIYSLFNR